MGESVLWGHIAKEWGRSVPAIPTGNNLNDFTLDFISVLLLKEMRISNLTSREYYPVVKSLNYAHTSERALHVAYLLFEDPCAFVSVS